MRPNYAAWEFDPKKFFEQPSRRERAAFMVRFAVLAPSSHNSQPWRFIIEDNGSISVEPEVSRALPATDQANRQLYVSLGCAVEAMVVAADAYTLLPEVKYEERPGAAADAGMRARLTFRADAPQRREIPERHPIFAILSRATNRSPHEERTLPFEMIGAVELANRGRIRAHLIEDQSKRDAVADLVLEGGQVAMADAGFRKELAAYLLPNNSKSPIGMTGSTVGMGLLASYLVPKLLPRMNPRKEARPQEVKLLKKQTGAFVVISTTGDTPADWMDAGRSYMKLALEAERLGLSTNNLAAPVTPPEVRAKLAAATGGGFPQMCFRLGYAKRVMPHCPRLRAEEVTFPAVLQLPLESQRQVAGGAE